MTKKLPKILLSFIGLLLAINLGVKAQEKSLNIHLFYSYSCPHCEKEIAFLKTLEKKYDWLIINKYEIHEMENGELFEQVANRLGADAGYIPFLVIGDKYQIGFNDGNQAMMDSLENAMLDAYENDALDVVEQIKNDKVVESVPEQNSSNDNQIAIGDATESDHVEINVPLLGQINSKNVSLPVFTVIIALFDGFNPCAMWVLLFLISMLLGMKDRRKMWILGGTFIFASGLVYFLFLTAWLNFFLFLGYVNIVQVLIGLLATGIGIYYLYDFVKNKDGGCKVTGNEKRKKIFERIKEITLRDNLLWAMVGMILLAFAVNVVELLCSAGLPAVYTKLLTMTQLPSWKYYMYLGIYVLIFMLDDMAIFVAAMATLHVTGIQTKYARFSHFFGGVLMLIIGLLMLFKPEVLMFG